MIKPNQTIIELAEEFDDTLELVGALNEIANDEALSSTTVYYVKESAVHLGALYSSYLEVVRALRVRNADGHHQTPSKPIELEIRSGVAFKHPENWTLNDYLLLRNFASKSSNSKHKPNTLGRIYELMSQKFGVPANQSSTIFDQLERSHGCAWKELLHRLVGMYLKGEIDISHLNVGEQV